MSGKIAQFGPISLMRAASDLAQRALIASRAGITFGGKRDLFEALGYKKLLTIQDDYRPRFERNGIASRVVTAKPRATWRGGVELIEDDDPKTVTDFEEQWAALDSRVQVIANLMKVDVLAGLGEYAVLLIGAPGALETPMPVSLKAENVAFMLPLAQDEAVIGDLESDLESERYGLPLFYTVKGIKKNSASASPDVKVHWSRALHVAEDTLSDRLRGIPRMRTVWNYLDDLDKVAGGGAESFWVRAHQGLVMNLEKDTELKPGEATDLRDAADEMLNNMRRVMVTRGTEVTTLGSDVANFSNPVDAIITLVSGSTGIPKRILVGSERGELASTQDRENWEQVVTDRRTDFAEPTMLRPLIDRFIDLGVLPEPSREDGTRYEVRWPEIESLTETEAAEVATKWAGLNTLIGEMVVGGAEIRDRILRLDKLDPKAEIKKSQVFNGAQVQAATAIVVAVGTGEIPADEATAMLEVMFGLTPEDAARIVGDGPSEEDLAAQTTVTAVPPPPGNNEPQPTPDQSPEQRAASSRGWKTVQQVADRHRGKVKALLVRAATAGRAALAEQDPDSEAQVSDAVNMALDAWAGALGEPLVLLLTRVVVDAGGAAARTARKAGTLRSAKDQFPISFDKANPASIAWARLRAAGLIQGIDAGTRAAIRNILGNMFEQGITPRQAVNQIAPLIGLSTPQVEAVGNLRGAILDNPGGTVFAGNTAIRVPETVTPEFLARRTEEYSNRLLNQRALTIARTETIAAANEGQLELWDQALEKGLLLGNEQRVWIATPDDRTDPVCAEMDGQRADLGEPFMTPDGDEIMAPPVHPNCRCATGLVERK